MLSPNHGQADTAATALPSGSIYLIRWVDVFVCFGFCLVVLDYFFLKKEEPPILLIFIFFRFKFSLFMF